MITDINQLDLNKNYTYADYLTWQFDEMVELIRGKVYRMPKAYMTAHQWVLGNMLCQISNYGRAKNCKVFHGPFDVRLPLLKNNQTKNEIDTVVQPDITVVCDFSKLDERGCNGAPDWVIEILSKSTSKKDLTEKFEIYQEAGIPEYWIIHPHECTVITYFLNEKNEYESKQVRPFTIGEQVPVTVFSGFEISLENVFPDF